MKFKEYMEQMVKRRPGFSLRIEEAIAFGIPWPPAKGWKKQYSNAEGNPAAVQQLATAKRNSKQARREARAKVLEAIADPRGLRTSNGNSQAIHDRVVRQPKMDVCSDAFLTSYEWRRVRMEALKKYGARCQCCGASPATGAVMNVDHIKPRRIFPQLALSLDNLQVLCNACNHGKGNWDMTDWRESGALGGKDLRHERTIR